MKSTPAFLIKIACVCLISVGGAGSSEGHSFLGILFMAIGILGLDFWADYRERHHLS